MTETPRPPQPAHELSFEPKQLPKLWSNYGNYVDSNTVSWLRPTPLSTPPEEIRKRYEEDGYLWVKNLLPREDVYDMRELCDPLPSRHVAWEICSTTMLLPHTNPNPATSPTSNPPRSGIFNPTLDPLAHQGLGGTPDQTSQALLDSIHAHPAYRAFLSHPTLRTFIRKLTGWKKEAMLNRGLLRHKVPQSLSTGIHYDRLFLRADHSGFLTALGADGRLQRRGRRPHVSGEQLRDRRGVRAGVRAPAGGGGDGCGGAGRCFQSAYGGGRALEP